jgi:peptidoglycan-associated lipoprotein
MTITREERVMGKGRGWKSGVAILAIMMVFAFGCAKKQAVKSTDTAGTEAPATAPGGKAPEGVITETLKPETAAPSGGGSGMQMASAEAAAGVAATEEKTSPFRDIYFDFDKSFIRDDAKPALATVSDYMKKNRGARLLIEGHCDERGTSEYNMALGDRRAEAARKYLISLGVASGSLSTVSFGKEKPLDPGHNEEAWAKNRRDHFVVK